MSLNSKDIARQERRSLGKLLAVTLIATALSACIILIDILPSIISLLQETRNPTGATTRLLISGVLTCASKSIVLLGGIWLYHAILSQFFTNRILTKRLSKQIKKASIPFILSSVSGFAASAILHCKQFADSELIVLSNLHISSVDMNSLIAALVIYGIGTLVDYASDLQEISDETV